MVSAGEALVCSGPEASRTAVGAGLAGKSSCVAILVGQAGHSAGVTQEEVGDAIKVVAALTGGVGGARGAGRVAGHTPRNRGVGVLASRTVVLTSVRAGLQEVIGRVSVWLALGTLRQS